MGLFDIIKTFFRKKKKLIVFFIDETGRIIKKERRYKNNTFTEKSFGEPMAYIVDHNFVNYERKSSLPVAFYYVNDPRPIRLSHKRNEEVDAIGLQKILDSKAIRDLFANEADKLQLILIILIGVNMLMTGVLIYLQVSGKK